MNRLPLAMAAGTLGSRGRSRSFPTNLLIIAVFGVFFTGCAGIDFPSLRSAPAQDEESGARKPDGKVPAPKDFREPESFEQMLDAKPLVLPSVKPATTVDMAPPVPQSKGAAKQQTMGAARFRIQLSAESNLEAAQKRKVEIERILGGRVDVDFDPPYYKLRWGNFNSRQEAQDKLLELSEFNLQGFVVNQ